MRVIKMNADKNRPMKIEKEILYRYFNGDAGSEEEKKIRQYLVDNNYVESVISLAANLFYGSTIAVNILVLS